MNLFLRAPLLLCAASLTACTGSPAPGGPTCAKACPTLATLDSAPGPLTLDATSAYFQTLPETEQEVHVHRVPLAGGPALLLASSPSWGKVRVAVDTTSVYYTSVGPVGAVGRLERVALGGGTPETLAADLILPSSAAVDAASVYVALFNGGIEEVPIAGGAATTIGPMSSLDLVRHGADLVSVSDVFGTSRIQRVSVSDGSVIDIATEDGDIVDIAVDDTTVYWTSHHLASSSMDAGLAAHVSKAPLAGGSASRAATLGNPGGIAVDAEHLYFVDTATGTLTRATLDGGHPEVIADAQPNLRWVAVDATHVYFTATDENGKPALRRMEK